jgi:hypothetical protein
MPSNCCSAAGLPDSNRGNGNPCTSSLLEAPHARNAAVETNDLACQACLALWRVETLAPRADIAAGPGRLASGARGNRSQDRGNPG